jgi:hypothetical protein
VWTGSVCDYVQREVKFVIMSLVKSTHNKELGKVFDRIKRENLCFWYVESWQFKNTYFGEQNNQIALTAQNT